MEEIFKIAGAIILSFGGSSAVLLALSSWLGKVWANRILEGEKRKHSLEIEEFKGKLNKEINLANSIIEKSMYVTKMQYDKEFSIYMEIWEKLAECIIYTKALYPVFENKPVKEEELQKFQQEKYEKFVDAYNAFSNKIIKYSPFYDEKIYQGFIEIRDLCFKQANIFKLYEFEIKHSLTFALARNSEMDIEERQFVYNVFHKKIDELQDSMNQQIRTYLKDLQTIQ